MVANHAAKKRPQGRGDERDVATTDSMQKILSEQFETARGDYNAMPLFQVHCMVDPGLQKDRLGASEDGLNMLFDERRELLR